MSEEAGKRIAGHLARAKKLYPGVWKTLEKVRESRGKSNPDWPKWCWLPAGAAMHRYDPVSGMILTALATWRVTKGIYRFNEDLREALIDTPVKKVPSGVLYSLPEWCVYIETPGQPYSGFFAYLTHDPGSGFNELLLLFEMNEETLTPMPLPLDTSELGEAFERADEAALKSMPWKPKEDIHKAAELAQPALSLLLYLCSDKPDVDRPPPLPQKRTRRGKRVRAPQTARFWEVGVRIGAKLRAARERAERSEGATGTHASPRAHIRRAHWHTYWCGPQDNQRAELRWLSPMLVGAGETVATVREVE